MSLATKLIKVTIQLANQSGTNQPNTFISGGNTVDIGGTPDSALRTVVRVRNAGSIANQTADVTIYGLSPTLMNQLATLGIAFNIIPLNQIIVAVGDTDTGLSTIFTGTIQQAYGDYEGQPNVPFKLSCLSGGAQSVISAQPTSTTQGTDVKTIMGGFASKLDMHLEDNGVSVQLPNSYFSGSTPQQVRKCAEAANLACSFDNNTLAIWPMGGSRNTQSVPTISKATGMIASPAFTRDGIIVKTLYNPKIRYGGLIQVESRVITGIAQAQPSANFASQWWVGKLDHDLDSWMPDGEWKSTVYAYNVTTTQNKPTIPPP